MLNGIEGTAVSYRFIAERREQLHVEAQCRVLKVSPSEFYQWVKDRKQRTGVRKGGRSLFTLPGSAS